MRPEISKVEAVEKYKLHVSFQDGTQGSLDLSSWAGKGVFKSWDEGGNFFNVFINLENGAITWPNEIDIDTYNAYFTIKGISPEECFKKQTLHAPHQ